MGYAGVSSSCATNVIFVEIHQLSSTQLRFHACGSLIDVLDDIIEIGVDVLNPIQVRDRGMETCVGKTKARKKFAVLRCWYR
jgi:hypothetical protein